MPDDDDEPGLVAEPGDIVVDEAEDMSEGEEASLQRREGASLPSPSDPTKAEREFHNLTHLPHRSWCAHCTRGRGVARDRKNLRAAAERDVPLIAVDYLFLGAQDSETTMPIIVLKNTASRRVFAYA
ncbi:unnamed protein product, partial [Polarella glacialis]